MVLKASDEKLTMFYLLLGPCGFSINGHVHNMDDVPMGVMETLSGKHIVTATKWEYYRYTIKTIFKLAILLLSDAPIATKRKSTYRTVVKPKV